MWLYTMNKFMSKFIPLKSKKKYKYFWNSSCWRQSHTNLHIKQVIQKRRSHKTENRQPNRRDENVTLEDCFNQQFQIHQHDHVVYHECAKAEKIRRVAFTEEGRIRFPNVPGEEVDDDWVINSEEHPYVEIFPTKETIPWDTVVESWIAAISKWSQILFSLHHLIYSLHQIFLRMNLLCDRYK